MPIEYEVRSLAPDDVAEWRQLYDGYARFYGIDFTDGQARTLWEWLMDGANEVEGLVAVAADRTLAGIAHYRAFYRPSAASVGGYLEDLYVSPTFRGQGAADALLQRLREIGRERGWTVIRWITADDNYRARAKYDQVAERDALDHVRHGPGRQRRMIGAAIAAPPLRPGRR